MINRYANETSTLTTTSSSSKSTRRRRKWPIAINTSDDVMHIHLTKYKPLLSLPLLFAVRSFTDEIRELLKLTIIYTGMTGKPIETKKIYKN